MPTTDSARSSMADVIAAVAALGSERDPAEVCRRVVRSARAVVDARYAAMGVTGRDGNLVDFIHDGPDDAEVEAIGWLTEVRGALASVAEGEPIRVDDLGDLAGGSRFPLSHPRMQSFLGVPIRIGGEVFGSLYLADRRDGKPFCDADQQIVEALAGVASAALDNARLLARAEAKERTVEALHGLSTALLAGASLDDVLHLLAVRAIDLTGSHLAKIVEVSPGGEAFAVRTAAGHRAQELAGSRYPFDATIAGHVVRTAQPAIAADVSTDPRGQRRWTELDDFGPWLSVPVWRRGKPAGALSVGRLAGAAPFEAEEVSLLQTFAAQASVLLDHGQDRQRADETAETLRRALLPPELPVVPNADVAARYRPEEAGIGGDFYDVFRLRGDSWGVVIGDICGSGPAAATMTALARHTVRTAAMTVRQPTQVLEALNDALLRRSEDEGFCSAVFARFRPVGAGLQVTVARAGHPYPIVVRRDGTCSPVRPPGELAGLFPGVRFAAETIVLDPGDALVLYTDGVTEARSGSQQFGMERLLRTLRPAGGEPAAAIADRVDRAVHAYAGGSSDDVAVLVVGVPAGA
jgi:serine phosphatase RsbU (regulator of sigma subunit)